jgi:hypothetical protein
LSRGYFVTNVPAANNVYLTVVFAVAVLNLMTALVEVTLSICGKTCEFAQDGEVCPIVFI